MASRHAALVGLRFDSSLWISANDITILAITLTSILGLWLNVNGDKGVQADWNCLLSVFVLSESFVENVTVAESVIWPYLENFAYSNCFDEREHFL